jgi:hypothetical protein
VFNHSPKYNMNILLGDFNAKLGEKILSNQQFEKIFYLRRVMIMVLA